MTAQTLSDEIFSIEYPSSDGEPVAETFDHLYALLTILETLREYLQGKQVTVLANQFLYYVQGRPNLRVAPDVMVIFNVAPGGRDNYKIWVEGQVPSVIFELTSESTRSKDEGEKKSLYQQLGVKEYWQFDPRGEWIREQLRGYRLQENRYSAIADSRSQILGLRLVPEGKLLSFYRLDTGEKLLIPAELSQALRQESLARQQAEERAEQEHQRAEQERQRAEQERQRAEQEHQRAEQERQRAVQAEQQAQQERQRAERLAQLLREQGIDPDSLT